MPIYIGDRSVVGIALGDLESEKVYHGSSLVFGGSQYQDVAGESPAYMQLVPAMSKNVAKLNMVGGKIIKQRSITYNPSQLPGGYTPCSYIKSGGSQYINLDYVLQSDNVTYEWGCIDNIQGGTSLFGSENGQSPKWTGILYAGNSSRRNVYVGDSAGVSVDYVNASGDYLTWRMQISDSGSINIYKNDVLISSKSYVGSLQKLLPIYLFANNVRGSAGQFATVAMYYFKIYDNGILVRNMIPCLDPENNPCMYDTVTGRNFYNAGSGSFGFSVYLGAFNFASVDKINVQGKNLIPKFSNESYWFVGGTGSYIPRITSFTHPSFPFTFPGGAAGNTWTNIPVAAIPVMPNTTYTITNTILKASNWGFYASYDDIVDYTKCLLHGSGSDSFNESITVTSPAFANWLLVGFNQYSSTELTLDDNVNGLQVEFGGVSTEYEDFKTPVVYNIPYEEEDSWGIDTVYNERNFAENKRVKRIGKIVLDGITRRFSGTLGTVTNGYCVYYSGGDFTHFKKMISDRFDYYYNNRQNMPLYGFGGQDGSASTKIFILPNDITSLAEANAWLLDHPTTIYYERNTPVEEEFAYNPISLNVYNGGHIIFTNSSMLAVPNEVIYKVPLDTLEAMVTDLYNSAVEEVLG